jgi:hypothetical protein
MCGHSRRRLAIASAVSSLLLATVHGRVTTVLALSQGAVLSASMHEGRNRAGRYRVVARLLPKLLPDG